VELMNESVDPKTLQRELFARHFMVDAVAIFCFFITLQFFGAFITPFLLAKAVQLGWIAEGKSTNLLSAFLATVLVDFFIVAIVFMIIRWKYDRRMDVIGFRSVSWKVFIASPAIKTGQSLNPFFDFLRLALSSIGRQKSIPTTCPFPDAKSRARSPVPVQRSST